MLASPRCCAWLRCGRHELPERERWESHVENGGVVDGQTKDDADKEKLLRWFEGVGVEVAIAGLFVVDKKACSPQSAKNAPRK